ncbi:MAG: hypothetical protein KGH63_03825, partial [Candidatus Micrarchaeota archaeon]|nr:hypothetical protein [Candidatus Micrarchaeota archaeon]
VANAKAFYKPVNEGIVPRKAADHHSEHAGRIVKEAMEQAKNALMAAGGPGAGDFDFSSLDGIAFACGPGLGPCLQTGAAAAAFLALKYDLPLAGVNHCHAHVEVARWQLGYSDPLALYVSGGNTQLVVGTKHGGRKAGRAGAGTSPSFGAPFRVLGETLDMGVGNLFDAFARRLGEKWAHGSVVAAKAAAGKNYHPLPYTVKGMNFAFSGLLTAAEREIGKVDENDLCYSLMETAFAELCEASERALLLTGKKEVVVCGGVAQNPHLVGMVKQMAESHGANAGAAENQYNADNGGMIALAGAQMLEAGKAVDARRVEIDQRYRIDQVE